MRGRRCFHCGFCYTVTYFETLVGKRASFHTLPFSAFNPRVMGISNFLCNRFQVIPTARDLSWKVDPVHNKILKCSFTRSYVERAQTASGLSPFEFLNQIDFNL